MPFLMSYKVIAGNYERPAFLDGQQIEKGTGQTILTGEPVKYVLKKQDVGFPNYTQAWGVRTYDDGKIPESPIDVKDPKYRGKIKFLPWGKEGGQLIECRYLKSYRTLDMQYQENVLNVKINENDPSSADAYFLSIPSGENQFDETIDAAKIEMLKIHSYNRDSISKNPESAYWLFYEKDDVKEQKIESKILSAKSEALKIVLEAADDNSGAKVSNLMGVVRKLITDEPQEGQQFFVLQKLADSDPELFISQINEHKKWVGNVIEKGKSYEIFDLTKDGVIMAGQGKKEVIAEGVPAKGDQMLAWLYTDFLNAIAFEGVYKLKNITDKLK